MYKPLMLYFADPMCSWCWGFSPVIDRVESEFGDRFDLNLVGPEVGIDVCVVVPTHTEFQEKVVVGELIDTCNGGCRRVGRITARGDE